MKCSLRAQPLAQRCKAYGYANTSACTYRRGARGCRASVARAARTDCATIWDSGRIFSWCAAVWGSSVQGSKVASVVSAGGAVTASRAPAAAARAYTSPWPAASGPGCSSRTTDKPRS